MAALPSERRAPSSDRDPVAVTLDHLRDEQVVTLELDGEPRTVWWAPGQASALDESSVDGGRDVGSTSAFVPTLDDDTRLEFTVSADDPTVFVSAQTGPRWNLLGEAIDGELAGTQLRPVTLDVTFWFVWFAFQPETGIIGGGDDGD